VVEEFGEVFPELKTRQAKIESILKAEETQFNRTLDRGLKLFNDAADKVAKGEVFPPETVVKLWETYGFPTDMTAILIEERELKTDQEEVDRLVDEHKGTGGKGQKSDVVAAVSIDTNVVTEFVGFDSDECEANVVEWIENEYGTFAVVDKSPFYIEKGGQTGDVGTLIAGGESMAVTNVLGVGEAAVLQVDAKPSDASVVTLKVDSERRRGIESHHTATHLFHWALHEVVSPDATQQGSLVAPDRLRFDFNSEALKPEQLSEIEAMVNRCITSNDPVSTREVEHGVIKDNPDVMQFFGDKYGDLVRVVQIGGAAGEFNGYSMELCGGTHTNSTGDLGFFRIKSEGAVAAGIRRVEAVCGAAASELIAERVAAAVAEVEELNAKLSSVNEKLQSVGQEAVSSDFDASLSDQITAALGSGELAQANELLNQFESAKGELKDVAVKAEKAFKKAAAGAAASMASAWFDETLAEATGNFVGELPAGPPALLQEAMNTLKARQYAGAVALALVDEGTIHFGVVVPKDLTSDVQAGKVVSESLAEAGGKGGGKPEMARGAAREPEKLDAVLAKAKALLGA
ncbi:MAG: alanine--tRNA ligase-related protein, partial [Verrucomicrobiota bacterium]